MEVQKIIFSITDHIEQIINGQKTQTRRLSPKYLVGNTYSIQPGRTKSGIKDGHIFITEKKEEKYLNGFISVSDALAEGGYTSGQFESLFQGMYPNWTVRYAYTFKFIPKGYCECGIKLVHKPGTKNWVCDDPVCTVWSKKYERDGTLLKTTRVAVPRKRPLKIDFDIIGEIS